MTITFTLKNYQNLVAKRFHKHYEKCPYIPPRRVDQQSLKIDGMPCFQWVCDMRQGSFLDLQELVYENFTQLFYANMIAVMRANGILKSASVNYRKQIIK